MKEDRAYVRVSTQKDSQKDSPEHQEAFIKEHAARSNTTISYVYQDRDSATSIVAREDVQQMITDAKRGEIRSLWFASLSRFSRDALDAISLKRILVNALKIRVVSIEDGYDSAIKDDELLFGIKSVINQNTSGDISIASRRGKRQSAIEGNFTGSIAPFGYRKVTDGKRKTLEVIPEQAEIVKKIFDLYLNGYGDKAIVKFLNGDNDQQKVYPSSKGGEWGLSSVQRILKNENYTGYTVFGKHTTEVSYNDLADLMDRGKKLVNLPPEKWERTTFQTHEAIISQEVFNQAQEIRLLRGGKTRGGRRSYVNVFAKMFFCAECGSAIVCGKSIAHGREYRYLICSRRRRMGEAGCSNAKWLPYLQIRDELIEKLLNLMDEKIDIVENIILKKLKIGFINNDFEKEKRKLEKQIENNRKLLFEIRKQNMLGEIDKNQYEFEKTQYEKEITDCENQLSIVRVNEKKTMNIEQVFKEAKEATNNIRKLKSYDDVDTTRGLLMQIIQRIETDKYGKVEITTKLLPDL
ncbi:recombinase family protein [Paenibacillus sp. Marseille-Q4541]|uniref:recombinase family protein n=1 Tax=Paenibacillus sp. Marseille-Q4541 TaxID=2831522 RepID=UPI0020193C56|nr:recombinase family protein [Paenibacillus sp. Marseille-Q4541]